MLAIKIWNYFRGYVIIRVEGLTLERLLNLAATHDIYLWDVKRENNLVLEMKSTTGGFKELREIVKKVGCRVEIKQKVGLPFSIIRLKERKMLVVGFLMFWMMIIWLTSTIWNIEIIGNEQTPKEHIISLLKDNNINIGKLKFNMNKDDIKYMLIDNYDYFSFVSVNIKGTKMTIEIKEQDLPPEKVDKSYPCHVVAKKKGVIVKVVPRNGKGVVEKGQVVNEGEILITGIMANENIEQQTLVHAEGEVMALTRYSSIIKEPIVKNEERETGKVYKEKGIKVGDKGIVFMKGNIPFTNYKEIEIKKDLINLQKYNISFPIKTVDYEYREVEIKEIKQNLDFLKRDSQIKATKEINEQLPEKAEIQSKNTRHQVDGNILTTQVIVEVLEDIGRKEIIESKIENKEE
ncbi:sporulation protein YqfD [Tissierella sp. MB52-C2]|uniref:sporulation protein YqfD n=1 Tax=Tissierella sp. MB52-C2 TaxID=3070999 RepID=UPI00280BBA4B|nr:sporulation protein YqfD [Tissierella sp. MB52-C2]WMM23500.1 sporulation protein YqfD [Tissierella sp. MB52-C2]